MLQIGAHQGDVLFGLARRDITPPVGIYGRWWPRATWDRVTGVHRPLTATAVVVRNLAGDGAESDEEIVVALDMCIMYANEQEALLAEVRRRTGVAGQLMCHFSHTHSAPPAKLDQADRPGGELIQPYLEQLAAEVAAAVTEARGAVRPASIVFGQADCHMGGNRDLWDEASQQYVCGFNPDGPFDPTVLVGRVTGTDGALLATLVNYGCHATTLAWQNSLISPDFPGAMREVVEGATGAPCVFLQGASGDTGPRDGFVGDTAVADRNGRELGYAALSALASIPAPATAFRYQGPSISGTTLGLWAHVPFTVAERAAAARWRRRRWTVPLAYRTDLPSLDQAHIDRERWTAEEAVAHAAGDEATAADCRARAEQAYRLIDKLSLLPPGPDYPLAVLLLQTGDAFWLAVEAEHYNVLQRSLRERFPDIALVVITLMDGGRVAYLPTAETYGKGLYQETIAVLAPGSLERLIDEVSTQLAAWVAADELGVGRVIAPGAGADEVQAGLAQQPATDVRKILEIVDLTVDFATEDGLVHAVDHVSYHVEAGETLGVVGESGSGKSVTWLAAMGLLRRTSAKVSGAVMMNGKNLVELSTDELRPIRGSDIAMIFQDPNTSLNPVMSIGDQIDETIRAHGRASSSAEARIRTIQLLDLVGIPDARDRCRQYPHEFSGGMRQRAMIAMAIANDPKVLVADEATTALDVTIQAQILEILEIARQETHAAIILITHDLGLVAELADRVVVMYAGRVAEIGDCDAIFRAPAHPYTEGLLGSIPVMGGEPRRLLPIPGQPPSLTRLPSGCAFHPRCARSADRALCREQRPEPVLVGPAHLSACHFWSELTTGSPGQAPSAAADG